MDEIKQTNEEEIDVVDSEDAEEEEEEEEEDLGASPLGDHGSLMMALASTNALPYEGLASPLRLTAGTGKPLNLKRGRGRPAGRTGESKLKKPLGLKLKRWKGGVYVPSDKSPRHSLDGDESPAHSSEPSTPATPTTTASTPGDDKLLAPPSQDDPPYFAETWPGKVCVLCNLGERSQLGQGEMLRLACQEGFVPQRPTTPGFVSPTTEQEDVTGPDKSPRTPALSCRRQKNWAKCRNVVLSGQEPLDELSIIGYTEEPDLVSLFENAVSQWHVYIHENCALWSLGVSRPTDADFQTIGQIVVSAVCRKCSYCGRLGASVSCTFNNCQRALHHPCAGASGAFQDSKSYSLVCNLHLDQVSLMPGLGDVTCMSCFSLGDVRNLTMCSNCGNHYHGSCVGLALLPGVRAGWQCQDCRICQICRQPEDSKVMLCETCDKAYHPHCLRPVVATIPKYGWKCKCCRVCSDCGSRTPGAGQSSRWHAHYTVCDSCYQQRNKGFSCPLCRRAYRAAAYREMVQCSKCKRFVHGTCDPDADLVTYQQRKESAPEYEYICLNCKNEPKKRKDSLDDFCMDSNMSASQESLVLDEFDFDYEKEGYGMGKGKPFCASKIAKKKLGLGYPGPGRPGKLGKMSGITSALMMNYQKKQQRFNEFGRKRMPKSKMRGIFGVPGLGLQKPQADNTKDKVAADDDTSDNKLVLCSAKDKFVLSQDSCVMCGALGTDQEGCLITCAQCGQCYHPYCANVKVTKVILQRGWRCLDCTVCEGCGQRNDEARLLLCDDCDISYHIYCMNPPLTYVPRGTWKCKWCAQCLTCGSSEPGVSSSWLKNYTECGPCGSRTQCPSCSQPYVESELIIKCIQCDRWFHCMCDNIQTEEEADMCAEDGYRCMICRPKDVKLPHLLAGPLNRPSNTPTRSDSPEFTKSSEGDFYMVDGVRLSESGMYQIRALTMEQQSQPRRRRPNSRRQGSSADILATIESVIAGGTNYADDDGDGDEEAAPEKVYREGMPVFPRADGRPPEPPEGFTIYTTESGAMVLRRKRVRNLQRLGIGGFNARLRQTRVKDREEVCDGETMTESVMMSHEDKPRRKPQRRKPKSKLAENYPSYLQEAFFGRDLLDTSKVCGQDLNSSSDEGEDKVTTDKTITLSQDELKVIEQMKVKQEQQDKKTSPNKEEDSGSDAEALKDILRLPDNLLDTELVNTIMTETSADMKTEENLMSESEERATSGSGKDELSDILGPHFNLVNMVRQTGLPNMDCKDVEEIFKGVLTEEPHVPEYNQQQPSVLTAAPPPPSPSVIQRPALPHPNMATQVTIPGSTNYHPEYNNTPQFNPLFGEWLDDFQFTQANLLYMEADEGLGAGATIAPVLFSNIIHPEWKKDIPLFTERSKHVVKVWRSLTHEQRVPYLQQARENRMLRLHAQHKKAQIVKETPAVISTPRSKSPQGSEEQDKLQQAKSVREAEQERQWKQLQALRQQQAQQQQQMMQDQRVQATQRVRQLTADQVVTLPSDAQSPVNPQQVPRMVGPTGYIRAPFPHAGARTMNPEMSRQLRDLLQRQQIKTKLESDRPWGQEDGIVGGDSQAGTQTGPGFDGASPATFRHPLPPNMAPRPATPRLPLTQTQMIIRTPRLPSQLPNANLSTDPRGQGVDARVRLLLQQRPGFPSAQMMRLATPRNPLDPYDHLVQRPPFSDGNIRPPGDATRLVTPSPADPQRLAAGERAGVGEEIPESVTAELEKLEQEEGSGALAEVEGVNAILGDLVEDDDELLAEMGADFNILEYADPELDKVGGGEKTNIFDVDEFEEEDSKKDTAANNRNEKKEVEPESQSDKPVATTQAKPADPTIAKSLTVTVEQPVGTSTTQTVTTPTTQPPPGAMLPQTPAGVAFSPTFSTVTSVQGIPRLQNINQVVTTQQRLQQLHRHVLGVGVGGVSPRPLPANAPPQAPPRLPPPYPGPPPPYPGQIQQEQPLLLEDLLEQEKREQEKQQAGVTVGTAGVEPPAPTPPQSLLSDADFERLRADVLGTATNVGASPPHSIPTQGMLVRPGYMPPRPPSQPPQWQQGPPRTPAPITPPGETGLRVPLFNAQVLPSPPPPPDVISTEEDRRAQLTYETWLNNQNQLVTQQLKYYETEVLKLRKIRKSLNSKQRQLRKNGNELAENDAMELQRVTSEQQVLQKQLESSRKQSRQHNMLMQEYRTKQQNKGRVVGLHSPSPAVSPQSPQQSPRIPTPHSQGDETPFSPGTPSPRPPVPPSTPRPPGVAGSPGTGGFSPQEQQTVVRHGVGVGVLTQPRPQPRAPTQFLTQDKLRMFTPQQQQQLLLQRHQQLQQQRQALLQQQQELNQEAGGLSVQQRQLQLFAQQRQALQQQQELLTQQMSDPNMSQQQRQQLMQQRQALLQQTQELANSQTAVDLARLQMIQRQQQFNRQQMLGKTQQSPSRSPMGQFGQTSPMPQHFSNATSPMPPQSPQFQGSSPMHPQSPMINQLQANSSPMMPQSPMQNQNNSQFQQNTSSPHPQSPMVQYSNQPPNSPIHPLSPRVQQNYQPQSPITTPQSPMIQSQNYHQTPNSPMTGAHHFSQPSSPRPPQSPRVQSGGQFQPPSSPMSPHIQQGQFVHRPNSPIRSPMPPVSPMPMRRPSSTGESQNSSPRTGGHDQQEQNSGGGGGNQHINMIPAPPGLFGGRFGYIKLGLRGGSPMWGGGGERTPPKRPSAVIKTGEGPKKDQSPAKVVSMQYEYEDESDRSSPSTSKSPQKKNSSLDSGMGSQETIKTDDNESTVYDDIVLVDNETNLEVEELQSSLQGNVMTMPMVIDGGHLQVTEMNLESENVDGVLDDCLVSSTNLVVLDVDRSGSGEENESCLIEMVDKDGCESVQEDLSILEEDLAEAESKEDESDVIEMMEESMSPPVGRKRLVGKVLPGESLKKLQEKRDSTTDTPDSPDQEEGNNDHSPDTLSEADNEIVSTTFEKTEPATSTLPEQNKDDKDRSETVKQVFPLVLPSSTQIPPSSAHQANIGIPGLTRPAVSYPSYPRGVPRHVFPLIKADGRSVIAVQQATVANLVQDAVNAAKLAAEKKQFPQGVSIAGNLIPTLISTPSTIPSLGVVSTTGTTLIAPPRMSVPFSSSARITNTGSSSSNTHYMPILSQAGGLLKIEVINQKIDSNENDKNVLKSFPASVTRQPSVSEIPEGFQKHFVDSVAQAQNMNRPEEKVKSEMPPGPHPTKAHSYSKILLASNEPQSMRTSEASEVRRSDIPSSQSNTIQNFSSDGVRHPGVICNKSLTTTQQSSVITQVSVISEGKTTQPEETTNIGSSILEAQLTASTREDVVVPRNPAVSSPSKTLFSFLDHMREMNKEHAKDSQSGSLNLTDMSVTYDNNKVHPESLTLYRASETVMNQSNISQLVKSQSQMTGDVKLPVSVMTHQEAAAQPAIRRIGNIYVHQNIKTDEKEIPDGNQRNTVVYSDQMPRPILEMTQTIKQEIRPPTNISDLFRQKQPFYDQKPVVSQQQETEPVNYSSSSTITSNKVVPTRLGELISGGTNVHAHIERRLSDMNMSRTHQQPQMENLQQKVVSSSEANPVFLTGLQRDSKDGSSQFIPLSSILTPKTEPDDKRIGPGGRITDDSQNVLLKQLLQNTACATTCATTTTAVNTVAPEPPTPPPPPPQPLPIRTQQTLPMQVQEPRRMSTDTPTSTLDELLSPTSPAIKREPLLTPAQIKREPMTGPPPQASPIPPAPVMVEVKKEVMSSDEMISPGIRTMDPMDTGAMDHSSSMPLDPQDLKKLKRRQYQQKRRQSQGKDGLTPKKRPRKSSKMEEDYDSFIDSLMAQLRQSPAMSVLEPSLSRNFSVCPIFGSGDLAKIHLNSRTGELKGSYGNAMYNDTDHYNTVPYGELLPHPPPSTPSTQRGFYNEEFSPLRLDSCKDDFDDRKHELNRDRDNDTPDTIVSSSSPELVVPEPFIRYPGLRLIDEDDSEEEQKMYRRSPIIPIVIPTAIKPRERLISEMDKENAFRENSLIKSRVSPSVPLKDSANVTVTLTLTSSAADDVLGVLRNLANILRIPAPTAYHITERTVTPPSHKLGLYRTKGKDGKEGAPVDIQSILNGEAKFCRHCDVIILNNLIRKKASEMPFLAREDGTEDLYFCSTVCYMQIALAQHTPAITQDKAAAVVDHLSQSDPAPAKKARLSVDEIKKKIKQEIKEEPTFKTEINLRPETIKEEAAVVVKEKPKLKGIKYRVFNSNSIPPPANKFKRPSDKEMTEMLFRMGITVMPPKLPDDTRVCLFCHQIGDGVADGPARLLNYDVDKWVHLNCALWSDEVYETVNGALMNVETVLQQSLTATCALCGRTGATLKCYKLRCSVMYHLPCAIKDQCVFYKNKTIYCNLHVSKTEKNNELTTLAVMRRVYVNRDENRQVASVMYHTEHNYVMRVGSLILLNLGQLLPHQLQAFHTKDYIYPIGYKIVRFYWSMRVNNKRCRYICSIHEANGRPEFRVLIQEPGQEDIELRDTSARAVWVRVLEPLVALRKANNSVQVFPRYVSGEDLFGLTEPAIVRVLESMPGVETLIDYRFKYGRNPLLELPLAINPSGCARCEAKPKGQEKWKRAHTQRTTNASQRSNYAATTSAVGEAFSPYSKQFVHSKSSQYKKMKQEWRNNVYLARSKIQGLGLYAARDIERYTMVIEYIGELIRTELAESREKQYEAKNRGIYMFRLDEDRVIDATISGGLARYINHSCNPNCVAEIVEVERDVRIIIFAKRRINRGEELAYDYKFDIEDDQHKIPCMCGAPNCRKWMN
ncbi:histone-lysine N-methyltransferase 2D-like isoform X3 [Macrosteles quadrilineatus]|uniref:histone-lysine N-methyltransferase 2D-like isoform X3 n=1 Tax=Macrosteles quadrilineatus TaxID=74068 RepID=UPI0023E346D5|nr:histone-lysine N-methyltransferase 2D-like isoform X3 [Macrosteles quadrilineatus]